MPQVFQSIARFETLSRWEKVFESCPEFFACETRRRSQHGFQQPGSILEILVVAPRPHCPGVGNVQAEVVEGGEGLQELTEALIP